MIDLHQMKYILENATPRSLIVVDEFGKGSELHDGIGLLCAVIKHFMEQQDDAPRMLLSTHFHGTLRATEDEEIFENDLIDFGNWPIKPYRMKILESDSDELTFLYKLEPGRATSSFGCYCAKIAGVPRHVIERSNITMSNVEGKEITRATAALEDVELRYPPEMEREIQLAREVVERFLEEFSDNEDD